MPVKTRSRVRRVFCYGAQHQPWATDHVITFGVRSCVSFPSCCCRCLPLRDARPSQMLRLCPRAAIHLVRQARSQRRPIACPVERPLTRRSRAGLETSAPRRLDRPRPAVISPMLPVFRGLCWQYGSNYQRPFALTFTQLHRYCEPSLRRGNPGAGNKVLVASGLPRRYAPRNDGRNGRGGWLLT